MLQVSQTAVVRTKNAKNCYIWRHDSTLTLGYSYLLFKLQESLYSQDPPCQAMFFCL
jgi:hypothetical protein